ncbi:MAG: CDGSH iron-sulfur domain-containing protein [Magnetococcales bacterium]|nr:CDGSH iron-sulfur domain-containing protein [Magnetococcales bacterium]
MNDKYKRKEPFTIRVGVGETVVICRCGQSQDPPFCTGAHAKLSTPVEPFPYTAEREENLYCCGCGASKNQPWCDGEHKDCPENEDFKARW